jgi:hypothetical protein
VRTQYDKAGAKKAEGEVGCCESSQSKDEHGGEIMREERNILMIKTEGVEERYLMKESLAIG